MIRQMRMIAFGLLLAMLLPAAAPAKAQGNTVSITVEVGYGGKYVVGRIAPVNVTVKNSGQEIAGTLELRTGDAFSLLVRREVILPQNTEKQFTLFVVASSILQPRDFEVSLKKGGSTLAAATPKTVSGVDPEKALCGILSDDPASMGYLKSIMFEQSYQKDWIELSVQNLYDSPQLLEAFGLIAVSDLKSGALTDKQYASLRQWVSAGGTLILGTGPGGEPAPGWQELTAGLSFQGSFSVDNPAQLSSLAQGKAFTGTLPILSMQANEGWIMNARTEDGKPLVVSRRCGRGSVYVSAFSLCEGAVSSWQGAKGLWMSLLNSGLYSAVQSVSYASNRVYYSDNSSFTQALQQGSGGVTLLLFLIVLLVFVLAAGIGSFLVLKALGRQKLMWVTVPVLAVLTSGVLLLLGTNGVGRRPYLYAFTSTDITGNMARSEQALGFVSPALGKYRVSVPDAPMLFPQFNTMNDYYGYSGVNTNPVKRDIAAVVNADNGDIEFLNVNLNGTRTMKYTSIDEQSPLEYQFRYDGKTINCLLKNNSEWPMENVTAVIGGNNKTIALLEPGKTEQFSLPLDRSSMQDYLWSVIDRIYPNAYGRPMFSLQEDQNYLKASFLREQASNIMNTSVYQNTDGIAQAYVFGWLNKPYDHSVTVNGAAVQPESLELLSGYATVDGGGIEIRTIYATLSPSQTSKAGVSAKGGYIFVDPSTTAVLDFDLSSTMGITINELNFDSGANRGIRGGTWSVFNWATNGWQPVSSPFRFDPKDIETYCKDGIMRLQVAAGANDFFEGTPSIMVQGVVK